MMEDGSVSMTRIGEGGSRLDPERVVMRWFPGGKGLVIRTSFS